MHNIFMAAWIELLKRQLSLDTLGHDRIDILLLQVEYVVARSHYIVGT